MQKNLIKTIKTGYTVEKLAETLGNMVKGGHGDLIVMIDIGTDGKQLIAPAGRGDIGIASDGSHVLVIRRSDGFLPILPQAKPKGLIH